ncbi:MAG: dihydroorotate dehydrogenase (quinone) [Bifidobacteriaceae bacterium]|jgi:dihydroorotate dehydrogenase|nr:dihydroorotate dehydrogenase (quinone) [Bifidobacteriaceae bacterium]
MLFERLFVRVDPEVAHRLAFAAIRVAGAIPPVRAVIHRVFVHRAPTSVRVFGRDVPGRLGLAAGFAKNAEGIAGLTMLGFSHIEIGTVTTLPQRGNERPRLWRIVERRALRNRMGFNNEGAARIARRLARVRRTRAGRDAIVGVNIGKSKVTPLDRAPADYRTSARLLAPYADYLVVNVSSPNTPGLRDLQEIEALRAVLEAARQGADGGVAGTRARGGEALAGGHDPADAGVAGARARGGEALAGGHDPADAGVAGARARGGEALAGGHDPADDGVATKRRRVPLLVKIAPDLADEDIDAIADLAVELGLAGVVAVNTTIGHEYGPGGLSGPPLRERGVEVVRRLRARLGADAVVIGVGGIEGPDDARAYLAAGATLVQAYTAFIYWGPAWPARVNAAL